MTQDQVEPRGTRFGAILRKARGRESRLSFSRQLELSYTFVRSMEAGTRYPSDEVLLQIARRLEIEPDELLLAAHCDRSPMLTQALAKRGIKPGECQVAALSMNSKSSSPSALYGKRGA